MRDQSIKQLSTTIHTTSVITENGPVPLLEGWNAGSEEAVLCGQWFTARRDANAHYKETRQGPMRVRQDTTLLAGMLIALVLCREESRADGFVIDGSVLPLTLKGLRVILAHLEDCGIPRASLALVRQRYGTALSDEDVLTTTMRRLGEKMGIDPTDMEEAWKRTAEKVGSP